MKVNLVTPPVLEPITLAELKLHLRIDSASFAESIDENQSIGPGSYAIYELLTLDVAPGGAGWAAGDTITGVSSGQTCIIVTVLTTKTYIIRSRSGAFTLGEILTNGTATADQGAAYPTFTTGYYIIGAAIEVLGYTSVVSLASGTNGATGTLDVKIQESDDGTTWTDWTDGAFVQITTANDNTTYEKAYIGTKRYIRTVAKILLASCEFGVSVIRLIATSVEDDLLTEIIKTARMDVENDSRRQILTATWDYFLQEWPKGDRIKLPFGNLQSITSIKWKDTDGTETTLTAVTDYLTETNGDQCGFAVLPYGCTWPSNSLYPSNPIAIRFIAGWTTAALIPSTVKSAIKMRCSKLYESRGEDVLGQTVSEDKTYDRLVNNIPRLYDEFE